jgi:DNA-binding GntR family transcriptional regulator
MARSHPIHSVSAPKKIQTPARRAAARAPAHPAGRSAPVRPAPSVPARLAAPARARGTLAAARAAPARARRAGAAPAPDPAAEAATPSARRSEAMVHDALLKALLGGALRPGTALRERHLAEAFGATRGAVRKVLLRLGQEGKLELRPNRGAYVPQPTADDVRRVYELRKVLECGIVGVLAGRIESVARDRLAALDALLAAERRAQHAGRRDEAVRLAGDFHLVLVDLYDNAELSRSLRALVARTQLFVALFESAEAGACSVDEHDAIVRALRRRDAASAIRAMVGHLDHVEQRVLARMPRSRDTDVGAILRAAME